MDIPITQLPPGDPRLVDVIVGQLKSKGIFDQLRKECLADVDTKPAFLNLRQRVDGQVKKFLGTTTWKNDLNKNQLRGGVRKNIQESGILDAGIDAIINQVVTPKIKTLILPYVESTVYAFLQIEKPKRELKEYDVQHTVYMEPPPVYAYGNPVPMPYPSYENPPVNIPKHEDELFTKLPEQVEPVVSSESDISVGGKSPMECESMTEPISDVLPMETDAISSEEDDILSRKSPSAHAAAHIEPDVKIEEDNAVDSFDTARGNFDVVSQVEKMNIKEDLITESSSLKDPEISKNSAGHLFDHQSLDSISSNSSGLSFSPPAIKKQLPLSNKDSQDSSKFPKNKSDDDLRSTQSTPLIDEKSPLNESITSSENSKAWAPYTLPKDLSTGEKLTFDTAGSTMEPSNIIGGVSPVSTETSQESMEGRSTEKTTSTTHTEESRDSKIKSEKSEGEITSSSSSLSSPEPNKSTGSKEKISQDSNSSRKDKSKHQSHSRDGDSHRSKNGRHHSRSRSKSKHDDHSSHRDKDKHYRRDKDDDKDKDKHSSNKGHHRTSISTATTSKSSSSTNESSKDKKDKSSDHHKSHSSSHSKHSSKNYRRDSKNEDKHDHKGSSSSKKSEKNEKKLEMKPHVESSSKSKSTPALHQGIDENSVSDPIKEKKVAESKNKRILKEDETFLLQLTKGSKFSSTEKSKSDAGLEKNKIKKDSSVYDEIRNSFAVRNDDGKQSIDKIKIIINKNTKNGEIKTIKNDSKLNNKSDEKVMKTISQKTDSKSKGKGKEETKISDCTGRKDKKFKLKPVIQKDIPKKINESKSPAVNDGRNNEHVMKDKTSLGMEYKKISFSDNLVLEFDDSSSDNVKNSEVFKSNTINKRNLKSQITPSKSKSIKKPIPKYDSSSDSSSSSITSSGSESSKFRKKVANLSAKPKSNSPGMNESASSDESTEETSNVVLKKITIPIFSFASGEPSQSSTKKNKEKTKKLSASKRKKITPNRESIFETASDDSEFEGFGNSKSPRQVKRRLKAKKPLSNLLSKQSIDSDSSDMDISIIQFCKSKPSKVNDFEGFGDDFNGFGNQLSADQKLKCYLSKFNADSCIELDDFSASDSDEDETGSTVFASMKSSLKNGVNEVSDSRIIPSDSSIPLVTIVENSVESSASDNDSGQSSMDAALNTKYFYSSAVGSTNFAAGVNVDEDDVTVFSSNCDAKDVAIQSTSESSIDSLSTMSDNYYVPRSQVICNMGNIMVTPTLETPKRKLSESSNGNGASIFPISKKRRILNAVQSEIEENMAKDNVIINSYSILTPEEDRTGSKEYDVDLPQKVNNYCPLSPASDSSAEELKSKNQDADQNELESSLFKET